MGGSPGPDVDPALLELFRAELDAHLPVLSHGLLALEKNPAEAVDVAALLRAAHSIKGAARIVGIEAAVRVAHSMEDCFTAAKKAGAPLVGAAVDVLLQGVDALQRICAPEPDPELTPEWLADLQERLAAVRDGRVLAATAPPPEPARAAEAAPLSVAAPSTAGLRVTLPPDFGDSAVAGVRGEVTEALAAGSPRICLDFAAVRRMSAGALALLAAIAREAARLRRSRPQE
jgi:chemotaxis protein histidine kinase CheA